MHLHHATGREARSDILAAANTAKAGAVRQGGGDRRPLADGESCSGA